MKKIFLLLFAVIFGCDKIPTGVVEDQQSSFQVLQVNAPSTFKYAKSDSSLTISVKLNSTKDVKSVWLNLLDDSNSQVNSSPIVMADNGDVQHSGDTVKNDNVYSAKIPLSKSYSNGKYNIQIFVTDQSNVDHDVALHSFSYTNNPVNFPPVISNLAAPDTLDVNESGIFIFNLKVTDQDGQNDIRRVFFSSIRPDGTSTGNSFDMLDNGNPDNGDQVSGDGIYSYKNTLPSTAMKGSWTFIFQAVDKSDSLSNIISHKIFVK